MFPKQKEDTINSLLLFYILRKISVGQTNYDKHRRYRMIRDDLDIQGLDFSVISRNLTNPLFVFLNK